MCEDLHGPCLQIVHKRIKYIILSLNNKIIILYRISNTNLMTLNKYVHMPLETYEKFFKLIEI